jgi:hypothetical protein
VLIDGAARYSVNFNVQGGSQFVSGWNNTGGGVGEFAGDISLKQLSFAAEPTRTVQLEIGGLYIVRGENTEILSYDNDGYIVGQRVTLRPFGVVSQIAATAGHIGDFRTPNVLRRLDSTWDLNYGQLFVAATVWPGGNVSADYTYEDGRDILRQGLNIRMPEKTPLLSSVRLEAYERIADVSGAGFNVSGEFRLSSSFTVTAGVAHVDEHYVIPGYTSPNGDRYERGTRFYTLGNYALTRDLAVGWFHGEAFNVTYGIPNEHRLEILVTINPTATLKAHRIF